MKFSNQNLIDDLVNRTNENLEKVAALKEYSQEVLNQKTTPESWSALECIGHLNRYGDFYLPEIKRRMTPGCPAAKNAVFKSGVLGNYFSKAMLPKEKLNKMKTFSSMNPKGSQLSTGVLDTFMEQQREMLNLLEAARQVNMTKTKTAITISKFIKLRLGDTLRVVIYHNQRHIIQAQRAVS